MHHLKDLQLFFFFLIVALFTGLKMCLHSFNMTRFTDFVKVSIV